MGAKLEPGSRELASYFLSYFLSYFSWLSGNQDVK